MKSGVSADQVYPPSWLGLDPFILFFDFEIQIHWLWKNKIQIHWLWKNEIQIQIHEEFVSGFKFKIESNPKVNVTRSLKLYALFAHFLRVICTYLELARSTVIARNLFLIYSWFGDSNSCNYP